MFKKPVNNWKTSAPLRSSDRRKLKQRVVTAFSISAEDADILVPDGIQSVKFSTHLDDPGVAYLAPDGDPLWFTLGKGSEDLIPTVYTLWRNANLLPFISTPKAVIPILVGGADLMIPGVVHCSPALKEGQLVSVCKYERVDGVPTLSAPLAVGRMAVNSDQLRGGEKEKGKAVYIIHTWKDHLWDSGSKPDAPAGTPLTNNSEADPHKEDREEESGADFPAVGQTADAVEALSISDPSQPSAVPDTLNYAPHEVSTLLHMSLVQAIATSLSSLPSSAFPIPSNTFYSLHILPNRPNFPELVLRPASAPAEYTPSGDSLGPDPRDITIKSSSHKSLSAFLKTAEKAKLLTTKAPQKHSAQADVLITSVNASHPDVQGHRPFVTIGEVEQKAAKKAARDEKEREKQAAVSGEIAVRELWKPHLTSLELFEAMGGSSSTLYTPPEIRALLNSYINSKQLVNPYEQAYINLDSLLQSCIVSKNKTKSKNSAPDKSASSEVEFMKRDELQKNVMDKMQNWYEVKAEGKDTVIKKGKLNPVQVSVKVRQGRKASTLITGFEPFYIIPEEMAEDLRKVCAGATSVSPIHGRPANSGMEVLVQGKQAKTVEEYLVSKGVPKKWIEVHDLVGKK